LKVSCRAQSQRSGAVEIAKQSVALAIDKLRRKAERPSDHAPVVVELQA
jgi:exonuclease III